MDWRELINFSRSKEAWLVLGWVALCLFGVDFAFQLVGAGGSEPFRQQEFRNADERGRIGALLSRCELDRAKRGRGQPDPLVLVFGLSTAKTGIHPGLLAECLGGSARVVNLGTVGGSVQEVEYALGALRGSQAKPDVAVLVLNPFLMAGRTWVNPPPQGLARAISHWVRRTPGRETWKYIRSQSWILQNYHRSRNAINNGLFSVRSVLGGWCGFTGPALFPPADPGAGGVPAHEGGLHTVPSLVEEQIQSFWRSGLADPSRYLTTGAEARSLARVLNLVKGLGAQRIVIVLAPEPEILRKGVPVEAERAMEAVLSATVPSAHLLDYRARIEDDQFYDFGHLNALGRRQCTLAMAEDLLALDSLVAAGASERE